MSCIRFQPNKARQCNTGLALLCVIYAGKTKPEAAFVNAHIGGAASGKSIFANSPNAGVVGGPSTAAKNAKRVPGALTGFGVLLPRMAEKEKAQGTTATIIIDLILTSRASRVATPPHRGRFSYLAADGFELGSMVREFCIGRDSVMDFYLKRVNEDIILDGTDIVLDLSPDALTFRCDGTHHRRGSGTG